MIFAWAASRRQQREPIGIRYVEMSQRITLHGAAACEALRIIELCRLPRFLTDCDPGDEDGRW